MWLDDDVDVVLLNPDGTVAGRAPKEALHTDETPLHLAFSCHLVDDDGRILLTRRALGKRSWPGVWTNAFCGHPQPDEPMERAIHRHARSELGIELDGLRVEAPDFRYRAVDASGVVENEICPVFSAKASGPLDPDPDEVVEWQWITPDALATAIAAVPWMFSPWLVEHFPLLDLEDVTGDRR